MLQHIRNVLEVIARRCCNVSGTSWKLLQEDVATEQERLGSYCKKMLQRNRNVLEANSRRCLQCSRNVLEAIARRCNNVSGTSWKLLQEDVATYQERLGSYCKKMLQRSRNILEVIARRCYNVSGTSWKLLQEDITKYPERLGNCCKKTLQRIRKRLGNYFNYFLENDPCHPKLLMMGSGLGINCSE